MSINRIQKLLFSEYSDFEDMVLVESPFAQTTRDGIGVRQVQLGLTPSKLVLATDILPMASYSNVRQLPGVDPDVETFELVAVYPIECVNLSVFRRHRRRSLKAHFCNNKVLYFELGGFETRNMFWNLWCEKVKFLQPEVPDSSHSETSVATSTTNSTLYLISSKNRWKNDGGKQIWCHYGAGDCKNPVVENKIAKWTDKHLYMGKEFEEFANDYSPYCKTAIDEKIFMKALAKQFNGDKHKLDFNAHLKNDVILGNWYHVNRFSVDCSDNCRNGLFLRADDYVIEAPSNFSQSELNEYTLNMCPCDDYDFIKIAENSILLWESHNSLYRNGTRHRRRYSFAPQSHFLHGLGPWNVSVGERFSVQRKRAASMVSICRQPIEPELRLPVSKRQLVASISCEELYLNDVHNNVTTNTIKCPPKRPVVFFWTPDYWYRPRSAKDAYIELQTHLCKIRDTQKNNNKSKRFSKKRNKVKQEKEGFDSDSGLDEVKKRKKKGGRFRRLKKRIAEKSRPDYERAPQETNMQFLKRMLKLEIQISPWDFDSATFAQQLTIIDRDLFLKIPTSELGVLIWQQSSKNAPNIGAVVAFSHRISCLVATEILKQPNEKVRARLIARFINTAEKCNKFSNYQSCKSILCGLQSPSIYRLYKIWTYIRRKHATKYESFQNLCKLYRDPRLSNYQKAFWRSSQYGACMPSIGDIILRLLDQVPDYRSCQRNHGFKQATSADLTKEPTYFNSTIFRKLFSALKSRPVEECSKKDNDVTLKNQRRYKVLDDMYLPLARHMDNRKKCLEETSELLEKWQKSSALYIFSRNELAMEYLLKARYHEERENFVKSFKIEPPYT